MGKPCSRIACSDVDIGLVSRISADERQPIDALHDLSRPPELGFLYSGEMFAPPGGETRESIFYVLLLPSFVILSTAVYDNNPCRNLVSSAMTLAVLRNPRAESPHLCYAPP
jgi:hypothetical protein